MFGFVTANIVDLDDEEKARYQALYCGLCHSLKECHGQLTRLCLSYDLTFLIMLLGSLFEPPERRMPIRCPLHPLKPVDAVETVYSPYAADMSVALAYFKCLDDWSDDGSRTARRFNKLLEKPYRNVFERWPRQCSAIEEGMALVAEAEARSEGDVDAAARHFGMALGSVFAYRDDDVWTPALWRLGAKLGRFIYFMDAAVDLDDDIKHDRYNPFRQLDMEPEHIRVLLMRLIGEAADEFERLPLERDLHAMRSVLYAGVWQQFCKKHGIAEADARREACEAAADGGSEPTTDSIGSDKDEG